MQTKSLNIAVMAGGPSAERAVSLRSGNAVARALSSLGHKVTLSDPAGDNLDLATGVEVVFLALHGTYGEDGTVQKKLDALGMPYTGCGAEASRVAFDKELTKKKLLEKGVRTARYKVATSATMSCPRDFQPPLVLKPVCQGSSVGLKFVHSRRAWRRNLAIPFQHDQRVIIEPFLTGREVTVAILDGQALPVVEVRPRKGAYDYHNKYTPGATCYFCPASFPAEVTGEIQRMALAAFQAIGARDYARVDMIVTQESTPVVLEINTLPGMTETSLFPKAAAAAGMDYPMLCQRMVELALRRHNSQ
jgi:D-alanine-D-alanine ligase